MYTYWFLDVGTTHDQSVLTGCYVEPDPEREEFMHIYIFAIHIYPVGYPLTKVVGVSSPREDGWHIEKSVIDYLQEYSIAGTYPVFGCDVTGNEGMTALFQAVGIDPVDIVFSGPAKSAYYQRYKWLMEKKLMHRIKCKEWESQASWLYAERSKRGYLMIHNINHFQKHDKMKGIKTKEDLDDCMDSTAGLIQLACPSTDAMSSLTLI